MDNGASSYRRFQNGDDNGIVEIIRDYKDGLILYLNGFVSNIHIAEELMEDTFVKIAIKKPRFSGKSSFKTWLYTIARNVALDYIRKNKHIKEVSIEDYREIIRDEEDLEKAYFKEEQKILLHKSLRKLNPDYRQVLYLVYFEGFTNDEVASVMKKNKRQIENLIYRAKQSLKVQLDKEGFVYEGL